MNTPLHPVNKGSTQHPMLIIAALAVILFCLVGTAAIMGWIPSSIGGNASNRELSEADKLALATQMQSPPAPRIQPPMQQQLQPQPVPQAAPRAPAAKPVQLAEATPTRKWCSNCGNVESVREISTRAEGSGIGAAGGAVLGGLLGNQVGGGHGRELATVAGAVGGAVVGNQVEGNLKATKSYEIRVRLDDGSARTFHQQSAPRWRDGDRVKIINGSLRSAG
jgi:outer membrane lipoprotein SlyB